MRVSPIESRKKMTLKEFADLMSVSYKNLYFRLSKGYSLFDAVTLTAEQAKSRAAEKHGMYGTPEYSVWESMHQRCRHHSHYLRRGVKVCDAWRDFATFYADMGPRPEGTSLDRYPDQAGNYEPPGNCRWATRVEQSRNTSRNVLVTAFGETKCVAEWAQLKGIEPRTLWSRIRNGYDPEMALTLPVTCRNKKRGIKNAGC